MSTPPTDGPLTPPDVQHAKAEVEDLLERLHVEWTVAGAFAADEYRATKRVTTDVDFLVKWRPGLPEALEELGFETRVLKDGPDVHLIRAREGVAVVDLIVSTTDYQREAIRRGLRGVLTLEDVLVHKVIAWRPKDRLDLASILSRGLPFDDEYVTHWTTEFGVEAQWEEAKTWR